MFVCELNFTGIKFSLAVLALHIVCCHRVFFFNSSYSIISLGIDCFTILISKKKIILTSFTFLLRFIANIKLSCCYFHLGILPFFYGAPPPAAGDTASG
jgi:hypothetical protein